MKRLRREISALAKAAEEDPEIGLHPSEDNIKEWAAFIKGPPDSPYEERFFEMRITVGADYPLAPPTIVFVTKASSCGSTSRAYNRRSNCAFPRFFTPTSTSTRARFAWTF